jgi:hypothetical protein
MGSSLGIPSLSIRPLGIPSLDISSLGIPSLKLKKPGGRDGKGGRDMLSKLLAAYVNSGGV